jgi:transcriptional regulator NrdR family protein|tara:strand:- start:496 stop:780 length:285 start_codon:yes stop_codon:yes gene_type:complete
VNCIKCGKKSKVYNSRPHQNTIKRHRKCLKCGHKYATLEVIFIVEELPKPKPKPTKLKLVKKPVRKQKMKFEDLDLASMTDEEIEIAISSGNYL